MGSLDIPEGADELPGVRDAMELGGGSAGTLNGYHDQLGRPGQGHEHQCKTQRDDAEQDAGTRPWVPRPSCLSDQDTVCRYRHRLPLPHAHPDDAGVSVTENLHETRRPRAVFPMVRPWLAR